MGGPNEHSLERDYEQQDSAVWLDETSDETIFIPNIEYCKTDLCQRNPSSFYCMNCDKFLCPPCLKAHNVFEKHDEDVRNVVCVSKLKACCHQRGHEDKQAIHMCETCQTPICSECLDSHIGEGHGYTEFQSFICSLKTKVNKGVQELTKKQEKREASLREIDELKEESEQVYVNLKSEVACHLQSYLQRVLEMGTEVQESIRSEKCNLNKMLQEKRNHKLATHSSTDKVIEQAKQLIGSIDCAEILKMYKSVMSNVKNELKSPDDADRQSLLPVRNDLSRKRFLPNTNRSLGSVRCIWQEETRKDLTTVNNCISVLVAHPSKGFLVGLSYSEPQIYFCEESEDPNNANLMKTELCWYTADGQLLKKVQLHSMVKNMPICDLAVFKSGKIAVLQTNILIYDVNGSDLNLLNCIKPKGKDWQSIDVTRQGELIAGDCRSKKIDMIREDGSIIQSIPCSDTKPWQLHALPSGGYVISQKGVQESTPEVKILNKEGKVTKTITGKTWEYVFSAVDDLGNVYVAHNEMEDQKNSETVNPHISIEKYTLDHRQTNEKVENILDLKDVDHCADFSIAAQMDGTRVALSSKNEMWIYK